MIQLYTGAPGSFKSYHATEVGIKKIKNFKRNNVIANFPIREGKRKYRGNWEYIEDDKLTPGLLIKRSLKKGFYGVEGSCLLIIDEAGIFFNSRDWQVNPTERKAWIKFFALSRHFGYDVILIAQDERMIDRQIRKLAEFNVKHVNLRSHWLLKWLMWMKGFIAVSFWQAGNFRGTIELGIFKPWIAKKYDTIRAFNSTPEIIEFATECGFDLETGKKAVRKAEGLGVPSPSHSFTGKIKKTKERKIKL